MSLQDVSLLNAVQTIPNHSNSLPLLRYERISNTKRFGGILEDERVCLRILPVVRKHQGNRISLVLSSKPHPHMLQSEVDVLHKTSAVHIGAICA